MDHEEIRQICLGHKGATEHCPFGPETLVFKVMGKMFALLALDEIPPRVNLKCPPELAQELRERHPQVLPGYHMDKRHWNTVVADQGLPGGLLSEWVALSYRLVVLKGLSKAQRQALEEG